MHHITVVNKQNNGLKTNKGNFRLASQFAWFKSYRERLGNNKGGATKGKY